MNIPHYRILERVGQTGMATEYTAEDSRNGGRVLRKVVPQWVTEDPHVLDRIKREALGASALNHPNICTVYEIIEQEGQYLIVQEYVGGRTLRDVIGGRPVDPTVILQLSIPVANALAAVHSAGSIHKDIKPAKILVTPSGEPKIPDFGLSIGTPAYMSPEQIRGQELDGRTDIFAFGAVMYEMATGCAPFLSESVQATWEKILYGGVPSVRGLNPRIAPEFDQIIQKAMEKDPSKRFQTASDFRPELERLKREM